MVSELELRTCGRAGCRWPAAASLSFRYATGQVWLTDLVAEPHPAFYDLCPHHADALTVPKGWERVDQRGPQEALREPSGQDLEARARGRAEPEPARAGGGGNRYAALVKALPRLAKEYGAPIAGGPPDPSHGEQAPQPSATRDEVSSVPPDAPEGEGPGSAGHPTDDAGAPGSGHPTGAAAPVPSRDLAPMPVGEAPPPPRGGSPGAGEEAGDDVPGQLSMPVEDEAGTGEAVVVSIDRGGRRRGASEPR